MKFEVRSKTDIPPDPKDKDRPIVEAFNALKGDEVLFVRLDDDDKRTLRGVGSALKRRLGKDTLTTVAEGGGLWLIPKRPSAGGSTAATPLPRPGQP